jgi:hypothetical protein
LTNLSSALDKLVYNTWDSGPEGPESEEAARYTQKVPSPGKEPPRISDRQCPKHRQFGHDAAGRAHRRGGPGPGARSGWMRRVRGLLWHSLRAQGLSANLRRVGPLPRANGRRQVRWCTMARSCAHHGRSWIRACASQPQPAKSRLRCKLHSTDGGDAHRARNRKKQRGAFRRPVSSGIDIPSTEHGLVEGDCRT